MTYVNTMCTNINKDYVYVYVYIKIEMFTPTSCHKTPKFPKCMNNEVK